MRRGLAFAGSCAFVLAAVTTVVSAQQGAATGDPFELFKAMVPVFSHDRCTGCHGRVNPELASGNNHSMGQITDTAECKECHADSPGWKTRSDLAFFRKTPMQLCQMQSLHVEMIRRQGISSTLARSLYLDHLAKDPLIGAAFLGLRGGASGSPDPPSMSRPEFLDAARAWLDAGAGCKTWKGTLTQTETFASNYAYPLGGGTATIRESANRVVTVTRVDGSTTAEITMSGHAMQQHVTLSGGCKTTLTNEQDWNNAASAGSKPALLRFEVAANGYYVIRLSGPPEKTRTSDSGNYQSSCGSLPQPLPGDTDLDWEPWKFTIHCPTNYAPKVALGESYECKPFFDAQNWPRLQGKMTRVLVDRSDADDPQSWLGTSPASVGRRDGGSQLPIKVVTEWDFELVD